MEYRSIDFKKHLAESYLNLVRTLDSDVEKLKAEGFATEADCLSVKVKVNEAKVTIIQVDNGLELLRMRLCQLCGLPLDDDVVPADAATYSAGSYMPAAPDDTNLWLQRPELSAVGNSVRISEEKLRLRVRVPAVCSSDRRLCRKQPVGLQ